MLQISFHLIASFNINANAKFSGLSLASPVYVNILIWKYLTWAEISLFFWLYLIKILKCKFTEWFFHSFTLSLSLEISCWEYNCHSQNCFKSSSLLLLSPDDLIQRTFNGYVFNSDIIKRTFSILFHICLHLKAKTCPW